MFRQILIIGAGGFLGTVSRFLTSKYIQVYFPSSFPLGTFIINVLGCFLIGLFYGFSEKISLVTPELRMFLTVGFCGGFTTFSTFANENLTMLRDAEFFYSLLYVGLSIFLGILAVYLGNLLTKII
ncbi:MAG: fluoride efflux transporter CrcB [Bacteroidota bacterium]|nr:fluoride efflux transporter CrcB [Bacteroidota bacterium]MDP4227660.1 fluoride efflux transporter CrcB [Bacteroidota bacterium]